MNDIENMTDEQKASAKAKEYGDTVQNILAAQYSINDQIAILKHQLEVLAGDKGTEKFKAFVASGEAAKVSAKAYVDEKYK